MCISDIYVHMCKIYNTVLLMQINNEHDLSRKLNKKSDTGEKLIMGIDSMEVAMQLLCGSAPFCS